MNELLKAAKAVIDCWDIQEPWKVGRPHMMSKVEKLRAAVERAENPPTDYNEWTQKNSGKVLSAHEVWTAAKQVAQLAERERCREMLDMLKECRATLASVFVHGVPDGLVDRVNTLIQKAEGTDATAK